MTRWESLVALAALETDDCVEWPFSVTSAGYGNVWDPRRRRVVLVHRQALFWRVPPPQYAQVAHGPCNNRRCLNYRHLYWATPAQNQADRLRDGTSNRGARHPLAQLREADVHAIRELLDFGTSHRRIAERFGISRQAVTHIAAGTTWSWLPEEASA